MPRGGYRPGGGRPKGSKSKKTQQIAAAAVAAGESPLEYLLRTMRDPTQDEARRLDAAKCAAPYIHPRLAATEIKGPDGGPLVVELIRFAADDSDRPDAIDVTPSDYKRLSSD